MNILFATSVENEAYERIKKGLGREGIMVTSKEEVEEILKVVRDGKVRVGDLICITAFLFFQWKLLHQKTEKL